LAGSAAVNPAPTLAAPKQPRYHFALLGPSLEAGSTQEGKDQPVAQRGVVKFFNTEKGFGFIQPDDGGRDIFVHISAVQKSGLNDLVEGQSVAFEVEPDRTGKGPKAVNLSAG
jgi:CspA family cold shock protein